MNACGPDPRHVSARTGKPGPATTPTHPTPTRLPPGYPPTGPTPDPSHPTQRRGLGGNTKGFGWGYGCAPKTTWVLGALSPIIPTVRVGGCVRRRPTLPHTPVCSTIGAMRLSFRVRNGTGRFPHAMTTETILSCSSHTRRRGGPSNNQPIRFVVSDIV